MKCFEQLYSYIEHTNLSPWLEHLPTIVNQRMHTDSHGDFSRWYNAYETLPAIHPQTINLNTDTLLIGEQQDCDDRNREALKAKLYDLHPWRKGPFSIFGINIITEWRSDLKWQRLQHAIQNLQGRNVLDVGCGSGYHLWRMLGAGARFVLGVEPSPLYNLQFYTMKHYIEQGVAHCDAYCIPSTLENLPSHIAFFDTVFSMGVLYHRRSPMDHLLELKACLRPGGELVLETLVIDGNEQQLLIPPSRYAKMKNVWFIPSAAMLAIWLERCGFRDVTLVDVSSTTTEEQRSTPWMRFESLSDFLHPHSPELTIEGLPAPKRAILLAFKP